jgi:hypothetical protein
MKAKTFDFEAKIESDEYGTITVEAAGAIGSYTPATMYDSHGDPGSPSDGGEVTYTYLKAWDWEDNEITFPSELLSQLDEIAEEKAE